MGIVPKRLPPLPTIADIIRLYGLKAKSQLSQNFLLDLNITDKIVRLAGDVRGCCVCEVGPGPGALTRSILTRGARQLVVVEKDRRFLPSLERELSVALAPVIFSTHSQLLRDASDGCVDIHHGDALEMDIPGACQDYVEKKGWKEDPPNLHIIGNLPFNVSIPLLLRWLAMIPGRDGPFSLGRTQLTLTFQKEVAERITAVPGHTQRSRLSVMAQHLCHVRWGFTIPGSVFTPPPKVDAAVLKLTPLVRPVIDVDYQCLEKMVKSLFQFRRKYIRRGASLLFPDQPELSSLLFSLSGVPDTLRAQQLSMEQIGQLCTAYQQLLLQHTDSRVASTAS